MNSRKNRILSRFLSFIIAMAVVLGILPPIEVSAAAPNITTEAAYDIEMYEATVSAYVKTNGGNFFKEHGFYYGKTSSCSTKVVVDDNGGSGTSLDTPDRYIYTFDDLDMNTKYYYKAYVLTTTGAYYYGGVGSFTTESLEYDIEVDTIDTDGEQTMNTLEMCAELYIDSNVDIGSIQVGFEYGVKGGTQKKGTTVLCQDGDEFGWELTGLSAGTTYTYRGYAIDPVTREYIYGDRITITTLDEEDFLPEVYTDSATDITLTSAVINGELEYTADLSTEYGFILGTGTTEQVKIGTSTKTKSFEYEWEYLQPNTKYTYKTYAKNKYGTVYGTAKTFTTKSDTTKPVIEVLKSSLGNEFTYGSTVTFTAEASDNVALSEFILYVDNTQVDYSDYYTDYEELEYTTSSLSEGTHTIKAYAVDDAGNEASDTIKVEVFKLDALESPRMTSPDFYGIYEAGKNITVSWDDVEFAEYYCYEYYDITDGLPGEKIGGGTTEHKSVTIPGNVLLANHVIEIYLTANTYSGARSEKTFNCIVIGASDNSITASDEEIIISSSGGSDTITVYSSGEWTARKSDSWFTISKKSGNGDGTIKITAEKNTTSDIRIGSIKLQDDTGEYYVIVQQAAKASSEFFNKIRVIYDSSALTISENDRFDFSGSAYNSNVDLDKVHVSITKVDDPDVGIDYFRVESIGDSVFDFSDIPSFYADEILDGLMVTNTQSSLILVPGESYYINIWVTDEDGYSSGKIQKTITIAESVEFNIDTPVIDKNQLTNTSTYIEATILETGVNSMSDYGFNILTQSGGRYQQYSLWQTGTFKDVSYNKKNATFSINASALEAGTKYYVEAFVIDSEGNVSFSNRANFTTKSAGVTITQPSNNKVYAANTTSVEFAAEVIGSGYSYTTFKVYDYDMNATGYTFTSSGSKPSVSWNISGVDRGTYYVQAETLLNDGTVTRSEYIKFDLYVPVSSIKIKDDGADTITVGEGEQRKVTATVTPSYATNKKISWSTNNKNIATVDKYGVVSGVSDGTTVLVAKDETGNTIDSCTLVITQEAPDVEELDEFEFSMGDTVDSAVLVGPTINFGGESFSLFEFPLDFDIPGTLWAFKTKYNEETETVQLILGKEVCTSIEQNVGDSDAYWKETYGQLKDMMNSYGMKTSRDFYNKFRKLKSDIRNNSPLQKANLGFEFDTELYGYIELNKNLEFVEGAIVLALSTELSVSYPLPPAPVVSIVFSIAADAQGKLMLVPRTAYYSGYDLKGELSLGITPGIAANIDVKAAEAEAKIDATLQFNMDLPLKSLEESLTISIVNAKLTLSYQMLKFINGEKVISLGDDIQLYPNTSASQFRMANTFALFQEEIDSSSEMQLIDTRNSASTYGRMMFALNSGINEVFEKVKDEMIDDTVYCYEPVDLVQLDDGREFAVWVKTDTERNVANETILYWSTKKNGVWEIPKKIHDDGTADFKPILAKTSDGNVHLIWQNSVKEFNEDVTLDEMGAYTELYHSVFNGIAFSTPTMITTNTDVMYNFVEVNTYGNNLIVAWSESNIETDMSTVKYILYSANTWTSPQVVINGVAMVEDLASGYINSKPIVAVKYDNDPLNTYSESILACYKNGSLTTIDNSADECNGLYIIDGVIYYLDTNALHSYNGTNIVSEGITIPDNVSNYQLFINDSGVSYIVYTASSGKYNNIFTHTREYSGEWSAAVQITDYDMKLYSIAGIVNNNELDIAYVLADDDDSNGYPTSNLYFTSVSNKLDICITESYYNTDTVMANGMVPVTITVKNNSLQTCGAYNVRVHDQNGYTIADTDITSALEPGQTKEITLNVQVTDRTKDISLHVTADDLDGIDVNRENNTVYINIPLNDIVLTYKSISKVDNDYVITIDIANRGVNTITGITAALYDQNNNGNIINSVYIEELIAGRNIECEFIIGSQYFEFADEVDLISFYTNVSAEYSELSYENNSKSLIFSYDDIIALQPDGNYNVSGQIISYGSANDATIIRVINNMGNIVASTTTTSGKYYLSVPIGNYTLEVSKADHVTREYEINVGTTVITQDVKICLVGDVDLNGKVNTRDWNALRDHLNKSSLIVDPYALKCADTYSNNTINTRDWNALRDHLNKSKPLW